MPQHIDQVFNEPNTEPGLHIHVNGVHEHINPETHYEQLGNKIVFGSPEAVSNARKKFEAEVGRQNGCQCRKRAPKK